MVVGGRRHRFLSPHRRGSKTSVGIQLITNVASSTLVGRRCSLPLTDRCRFLAFHTLSPSSLLRSRVLSIYKPAPTTSVNTGLRLESHNVTSTLAQGLTCLGMQIHIHKNTSITQGGTQPLSPGSQAASVGESAIFYPGMPRSANTKQYQDSTWRDNATSPGSQAASVDEFAIFYPGLTCLVISSKFGPVDPWIAAPFSLHLLVTQPHRITRSPRLEFKSAQSQVLVRRSKPLGSNRLSPRLYTCITVPTSIASSENSSECLDYSCTLRASTAMASNGFFHLQRASLQRLSPSGASTPLKLLQGLDFLENVVSRPLLEVPTDAVESQIQAFLKSLESAMGRSSYPFTICLSVGFEHVKNVQAQVAEIDRELPKQNMPSPLLEEVPKD
eukprot:Gb_18480 [translate_table: standard]